MPKLDFGVCVGENFSMAEGLETAAAVEEMGFDSLWLVESVGSGTTLLEPLVTLAVFATRTRKVSLGPAVVILPLRNPVGLAHAGATLDMLSNGRFALGIGVGERSPQPFEAYGVPVKERGSRCEEALEIIKRLWTEETVSYEGRYWSLDDYGLGLKPVQKPHPPIWFAGARAESVVKRAARLGDAIYPTRTTPSELAGIFQRLDGYRLEYGRSGDPFVKAVYLRLCISDTVQRGRALFVNTLESRYRIRIAIEDDPTAPPGGDGAALTFGKHELIGDPDYISENIREYAEAGVTHVVLDMSCPREQIIPQLKLFTERVMPKFK